MTTSVDNRLPVAAAFDGIADQYDYDFTFSSVGQSQREAVWKRATAIFQRGSHVLELNCGTGEDALHLAEQGIRVTACDASGRMIECARSKMALRSSGAEVDFQVLPTERIFDVPGPDHFDGVFSNFSGLNCVSDLAEVGRQLGERLRPGAPLLLCLSTRFCVWEMLHFLSKGSLRKALRRWSGVSHARLSGYAFPVYYPTLSSLSNSFAPGFTLKSVTGIGITVPPSYLESWISRHPRLLQLLTRLDETICNWPVLRCLGDHMLIHLEKL